ncbi:MULTISPECIES: aromatic ring-hydroxylating dioxygenase subunit alpha [unclassified Beijerinckia]|uniref:aromatic ring-hydroxylating dioxygenase subunit alpha n=1 Tax=unclassified Beijerinckia TaxID=2638183 RepID=UPI00089489CB|nr:MULTISPECIES: aromatic ring-hydroxylating dioxygenase subunit alpha [unclassified Beijerinckia]MDH7794049.1 phenylpropionate dioxygenase-like ring-hydroxylating dioxygenase large terminal subunit [Beijerinckia sp. GAS462]SEB52173.1 vanillate O-demethylase monooxygenase subunit [Beijerinckia sp. 28-YEA-48]
MISTTAPQRQHADHTTPLIRNAWYIAGLSSETGRDLLPRTLLETRVVLFRKRDGSISALHDRCPHRSFPLSKSRLEDDTIVCGYHGITYDGSGRCLHVPSAPSAGANIKIRHFPVIETAPLVWIWMGDAEKADPALIPDFSFLSDPNWKTVSGSFSMRSNYVAMHENLLDQTHFTFLHAGSVGTPEWATSPLEVSQNGDSVSLRRELKNSLPPGIYGTPMKLEGRMVDRLSEASFFGPAGHLALAKITVSEPVANEREEFRVNILHVFTPETQNTLHYWWFNSRDFGLDDEAASKFLYEASHAAYVEDVDALGWISEIVTTESDDYREFSFRSDRPGLMMRQVLSRLAAQEQVQPTAVAAE